MGSEISSDTDTRSSTLSPLSDDDFSGVLQNSNEFGLLPYQFEPQCVLSSDGSDDENNEGASDEEIQMIDLAVLTGMVKFYWYFIFILKEIYVFLRTSSFSTSRFIPIKHSNNYSNERNEGKRRNSS